MAKRVSSIFFANPSGGAKRPDFCPRAGDDRRCRRRVPVSDGARGSLRPQAKAFRLPDRRGDQTKGGRRGDDGYRQVLRRQSLDHFKAAIRAFPHSACRSTKLRPQARRHRSILDGGGPCLRTHGLIGGACRVAGRYFLHAGTRSHSHRSHDRLHAGPRGQTSRP
jgi:hypothetical protein